MNEKFYAEISFDLSVEDRKLFDKYSVPAKECAKEGNYLDAIKLIDEILKENPSAEFALIQKVGYLFNLNENPPDFPDIGDVSIDNLDGIKKKIAEFRKKLLRFGNQLKECVSLINKALKVNSENADAKKFREFIEINSLKRFENSLKSLNELEIKISSIPKLVAGKTSNTWQLEVMHDGLNKYRLIRGKDKYIVEQKAAAQQAVWNEMWQRKLEKEQKIKDKQSKNELAMKRTREAMEAIEKIENILKHTLTINDRVDWEALKDKAKFSKAEPQLPKLLDIPPPT